VKPYPKSLVSGKVSPESTSAGTVMRPMLSDMVVELRDLDQLSCIPVVWDQFARLNERRAERVWHHATRAF